MKLLKSEDLSKISGGISAWGGVAIAAIVVFLSGVIEGFTNPGRCEN